MFRAVRLGFAPVLLVTLAGPSESAAQTGARVPTRAPIEFAWSAPKECPSGAEVRPRIEALEREAAKLSLRGTITHAGDHYVLVLHVTTRGEEGSRTLEDPNCGALVDAAMVVLELSLAPKEDVPKAATPPTAPIATATTHLVAAPPAAMPHVTVTAAVESDFGTMPRAAMGILVGGELRLHPHIGVEVLAVYLPPVEATSGNVSVSVQTLAASALGCYLTRPERLVFGACAGLTVGASLGNGAGARNTNTSGTGLLFSPVMESHFRLQLTGPLGLTLGGAIALPLQRARFVVSGVGAVHQVGYVTGSAYLGPSLTF